MRVLLAFLATLVLALAAPGMFNVYLIDAEGGRSFLIVMRAGEFMLIDVGWLAGDALEASADRIVAAVSAAAC